MKTPNYPTDLTDAQWELLQPHLVKKPGSVGRPPKVDYRAVVNAILYHSRTGCQYRYLPKDFPPWQTVYYYLQRWTVKGTLDRIHDALRQIVREEKRPQERTTASVDSQSTDSHGAVEARAFDGGKKLDGRKRHILVDSLGLILAVVVTAGNVSDAEGGKACLERMPAEQYPHVVTIFGDHAYTKGGFPERVKGWRPGCRLNAVLRPDGAEGFVLLKYRWVVERTWAWLTRHRRLCRSYEHTVGMEESHIKVASISVMLNKLNKHKKPLNFCYRAA